MSTLVSLGCSWTYGVGVGFDESTMWNSEDGIQNKKFPYNYTKQQYNNIKGAEYPSYEDFIKNRKNKDFFKNHIWEELLDYAKTATIDSEYFFKKYSKISHNKSIADEYSFRGIISKSLDLKNNNFSSGGSSNDMQFFQLARIFGNPIKRKKFIESKPIILWGITSTARIMRNDRSFLLTHSESDSKELQEYIRLYLKLGFYNHDESLEDLSYKIEIWNTIFENYNIPVLWFDTFNTHDYKIKPRNFLTDGDLLTQMLKISKTKYKSFLNLYHFSSWIQDDPRITAAVKAKLLNPHSFHPTKQGHKVISEILLPHIKELNKIYYN